MAVIPWALAIAGRRAVAAGVRRGLATGAGRFIVTAAWGMVEALRYSTVGRRFGMFRDWGW